MVSVVDFVPKKVFLTLTLATEAAVQELEDFKNRHGFKDESEVIQFAYRVALNLDVKYGIALEDEGNLFRIKHLTEYAREPHDKRTD